jgi:hypothetical protein
MCFIKRGNNPQKYSTKKTGNRPAHKVPRMTENRERRQERKKNRSKG